MRRAKGRSHASELGKSLELYTVSMKSRSDILYKQLFAHPEIVRDLLTTFLSAQWARSLEVGA